MADVLILAVVGLIIGLAAGYIRREKKKGKTCVGCPYGGMCATGEKDGCGGCHK